MTPCIAYGEDGLVCRGPARYLDQQRGGMVCGNHLPSTPDPRPFCAIAALHAARDLEQDAICRCEHCERECDCKDPR